MRIQSLILCVFAAACATTPNLPPTELGEAIVADLEAGESNRAARRFDAVANDRSYRERVYPIVFDAAGRHYERGNGERAATLLRFLVERFPEASSTREAFVYALFLERAGTDAPSDELVEELSEQTAALIGRDGEPPRFVHLAAAQAAADRGEFDAARADLDHFLTDWDGHPTELLPYVEDLGRYITVAGGAQ